MQEMQSLIGSRQIAKEPGPLEARQAIKETAVNALPRSSQENTTHVQHSKQTGKSCEVIQDEQEKEAVSSPSFQEREGALNRTIDLKQFETEEKDRQVEVRFLLQVYQQIARCFFIPICIGFKPLIG